MPSALVRQWLGNSMRYPALHKEPAKNKSSGDRFVMWNAREKQENILGKMMHGSTAFRPALTGRHPLASVKHHGTNLGRRVGLCLRLVAVRKHLQGVLLAQVIRSQRCLKEYLYPAKGAKTSPGPMSHKSWRGVKTFKVFCSGLF